MFERQIYTSDSITYTGVSCIFVCIYVQACGHACVCACVCVCACACGCARVCRYTCAYMSARVRWYHHHKSLPAPPTSVGTCLNKDDIRVRECGVIVWCACVVGGGGVPSTHALHKMIYHHTRTHQHTHASSHLLAHPNPLPLPKPLPCGPGQ